MARILDGMWMVCVFTLIFFNLPVTSILRVFNPEHIIVSNARQFTHPGKPSSGPHVS